MDKTPTEYLSNIELYIRFLSRFQWFRKRIGGHWELWEFEGLTADHKSVFWWVRMKSGAHDVGETVEGFFMTTVAKTETYD